MKFPVNSLNNRELPFQRRVNARLLRLSVRDERLRICFGAAVLHCRSRAAARLNEGVQNTRVLRDSGKKCNDPWGHCGVSAADSPARQQHQALRRRQPPCACETIAGPAKRRSNETDLGVSLRPSFEEDGPSALSCVHPRLPHFTEKTAWPFVASAVANPRQSHPGRSHAVSALLTTSPRGPTWVCARVEEAVRAKIFKTADFPNAAAKP